ncbi:MAG: endolytic transglycosylase MltG [Treponemataceae bacterium]
MKKKLSFFLTIFISLTLVFSIAIVLLIYSLLSPAAKNQTVQSYTISIPFGASSASIAAELQRSQMIRSQKLFYYLVRMHGTSIKAGRYTLSNNMSTLEVIALLESGKQNFIRVIIPEGFTLSKIGSLLEKNNIISKEDFLLASTDNKILEKYRIPAQNIEGYIFPDTYFLHQDMRGIDILNLLVGNFFKKLEELQIPTEDPIALHKTIILASIVEREYRQAKEAPLMASVFLNRIEQNMGLESCATIVYILTELQGKPHPEIVTYADLKIDNPYNTYKWAGFPAGPISNPGKIALHAAAFAPKTDFFFFRLINDATGEHIFSATFNEHRSAGKNLAAKKAAGT